MEPGNFTSDLITRVNIWIIHVQIILSAADDATVKTLGATHIVKVARRQEPKIFRGPHLGTTQLSATGLTSLPASMLLHYMLHCRLT